MKKIIFGLAIVSASAFAHDGGHGPKVSDTGKYGGLVSALIKKTDMAKGTQAELVHKAELSRAEGSVHIYIYDKNMTPVDLATFEDNGEASLAAKVKGKWKTVTFPLAKKGNAFEGKMPKPIGKPYNIDVTLKSNGTDFLSAFDNLD